MARVVIAGAGVAGLGTALYAARAGHVVVLVERDDTPLPASATEAFWWDRRGAPQVRHSHAFLARLRNQLRDDHPDVLGALLAVGATEMDFIAMLPEGMDRSPMEGDEDLVALACRRTTFEWVLRRAVLAEGSVRLVHGSGVTGLLTPSANAAAAAGATLPVPMVCGLALADGTDVEGDVVVLAGGRRMDVPALASGVGATVGESVQNTGIVYLSRFFRLHDGAGYPPQIGPIGGDLGYLKYGVFPGDDRTFSITLAVPTNDAELRRRLLDPDGFITVATSLPATSAHVDGRAEPLTGVEVMGGLINRSRRFVAGHGPVVAGMHAVGDAHTATNPLYGRGCSLAMAQAAHLVRALDTHGLEHLARAEAYEHWNDEHILPWYRAAVAQDRMNATAPEHPGSAAGDGVPARESSESDPAATAPDSTEAEFFRSLLRDGLFPAMRVDPVVLRAFLRMFNLLEAPDSLRTNADVIGRVLAVHQARDVRPVEQPLGPPRAEVLAALG